MIQRQIGIVLLATGLLLGNAWGQADYVLPANAQDLLKRCIQENDWVGGVAGIWENGEVRWIGVSGHADREGQKPVEPETVYRIASLTKSMTATAVMQLVEKNQIDLDATVQTYVPYFPEKNWPIPVRHVLNHTSGIRHYKFDENRPTQHYSTLRDAVNIFKDDRVPFESGTRYRYTTFGYTLLGAVIEAASGSEYEAYMRDNIWKPAGMIATQLERRELPPNARQAQLYRKEGGAVVIDTQTDLSSKYPGGGVTSTASDMLRFAGAFMDDRLLKPTTREQMFHPPTLKRKSLPYGFGWIIEAHPEFGRVVQNDGGQAGTTTFLILYLDRGIAAVVMTNIYGEGGAASSLGRDLAALALND